MFLQDRDTRSRSFLPVLANDMETCFRKNILQTPTGGIVRLQYGCSKSPWDAFKTV